VPVREGLVLILWLWVAGPALADGYEAGRRAYLAGDYIAAHRLWLAATRARDPEPLAALGLGLLYERGLGVPRSPRQALAWYRWAAEQGVVEAAYQVGLMLELGLGVEADPWAAEAWYERAVGQGFCPGEIADPAARIAEMVQ
jgi:TPR repeat protein